MQAFLDGLGEIDLRTRLIGRGKRGHEIVLRLHHVGRFNDEQGLVGAYHISRLCEQL